MIQLSSNIVILCGRLPKGNMECNQGNTGNPGKKLSSLFPPFVFYSSYPNDTSLAIQKVQCLFWVVVEGTHRSQQDKWLKMSLGLCFFVSVQVMGMGCVSPCCLSPPVVWCGVAWQPGRLSQPCVTRWEQRPCEQVHACPPWACPGSADKARLSWGRAVERGCRNASLRKRGDRSMGAWDVAANWILVCR